MNSENNAVIYCRVSQGEDSKGDTSKSPTIQYYRAKDYCDENNLNPVAVVADYHVSGDVPFFERPQGSVVEEILKAGLAKNLIVVWGHRLSRHVEYGLRVCRLCKENYDTDVHVTKAMIPGKVKLNTTAGLFAFVMESVHNESQVREIRRLTQEAIDFRKENNMKYCKSKFGYKVVEKGNVKYFVKNQDHIDLIDIFIYGRNSGLSYSEIAKKIRLKGIKSPQGKSIYRNTLNYYVQRLKNNPEEAVELMGEERWNEFQGVFG